METDGGVSVWKGQGHRCVELEYPYLEHLEKTWKIAPAVNQVELHPYCPQHKLKKWCEDRGILLEAYCPLGSTGMTLLDNMFDYELLYVRRSTSGLIYFL